MTSAQIAAQRLGQVTDNLFQMLVRCHLEVTVIQKLQRGIRITNHMMVFYGVKVGVLFSVFNFKQSFVYHPPSQRPQMRLRQPSHL